MISVIAERFIKMLKSKIYKRMTDNDSKSYLPYLNKILVNAIILVIILLIKIPLMLIILFRLRMRTTNYKNISIKIILKILQEKYSLSILF